MNGSTVRMIEDQRIAIPNDMHVRLASNQAWDHDCIVYRDVQIGVSWDGEIDENGLYTGPFALSDSEGNPRLFKTLNDARKYIDTHHEELI